MKYNTGTMSFEGKDKKSEQQFESPENKTEKELSLSEIDELIRQNRGIFDNLDKFSKDQIFKDLFKNDDFYKEIEIRGRLNDEYDSIAYQKAGFWEKLDNFSRFGLFKNWHGLMKSEERGLLDKSEINKDVLGKEIEQSIEKVINSSEIEKLASGKKLVGGLKTEDVESVKQKFFEKERTMTKRYEIIDGEIVKIIKSRRTESGAIEAAGKMREVEISRLETANGAELIGLKEAMDKNIESKKNLSKVIEFMSDEEKEKITAKLEDEESKTKKRIKEKEGKLAEELKIFREPLEGRVKETLEIENSLMEAFDSIKFSESNLNEQIKEYEEVIKEAKKLNLLGEVGGDIVKNLEEKKTIADGNVKELVERKSIVLSKLETLKENKKEIETTLNRINIIGKTKKEIAEEDKNKKKFETKTKLTEEKKDEDEEKDKSKKTEGGKKSKQKTVLSKKVDGKKVDIGALFEHYDDVSEETKKVGGKEIKEVESFDMKKFSEKEIKNIVMKELKILGIMNLKDKKIREQIIKDIIATVKFRVAKSKEEEEEEEVEINDIKITIKEWYEKLSKNYFKKGKQPKT